MARIRTVKPEFWVSEQVVECSPIARLLFIGMWNFCDDYGIHPASARTLKMEIFPGDDFTTDQVQEFVNEIIDAGLIDSYVVDGKGYWQVTGWHHQKIEKPTSKYPRPQKSTSDPPRLPDNSPSGQRAVGDPSTTEGKGREGKGEDINPANAGSSAIPPTTDPEPAGGEPTPPEPTGGEPIPNVPHGEIVAAYNEILATHGLVAVKTKLWAGSDRERALRTRWREDPTRQSVDWWRGFFEHVAKSDFLMGRVEGPRKWSADLGWLLKRENFVKVCEGKYHA